MDNSKYYWQNPGVIYDELINIREIISAYHIISTYYNSNPIRYPWEHLRKNIIFIKKHLHYYLASDLPKILSKKEAINIIRQAEEICKKEIK